MGEGSADQFYRKNIIQASKSLQDFCESFWEEEHRKHFIDEINMRSPSGVRIRLEKKPTIIYCIGINIPNDPQNEKWMACKIGLTQGDIEKPRNRMKIFTTTIKKGLPNQTPQVIFKLPISATDTDSVFDIEDTVREKFGYELTENLAKSWNLPNKTDWVITTKAYVDKLKEKIAQKKEPSTDVFRDDGSNTFRHFLGDINKDESVEDMRGRVPDFKDFPDQLELNSNRQVTTKQGSVQPEAPTPIESSPSAQRPSMADSSVTTQQNEGDNITDPKQTPSTSRKSFDGAECPLDTSHSASGCDNTGGSKQTPSSSQQSRHGGLKESSNPQVTAEQGYVQIEGPTPIECLPSSQRQMDGCDNTGGPMQIPTSSQQSTHGGLKESSSPQVTAKQGYMQQEGPTPLEFSPSKIRKVNTPPSQQQGTAHALYSRYPRQMDGYYNTGSPMQTPTSSQQRRPSIAERNAIAASRLSQYMNQKNAALSNKVDRMRKQTDLKTDTRVTKYRNEVIDLTHLNEDSGDPQSKSHSEKSTMKGETTHQMRVPGTEGPKDNSKQREQTKQIPDNSDWSGSCFGQTYYTIRDNVPYDISLFTKVVAACDRAGLNECGVESGNIFVAYNKNRNKRETIQDADDISKIIKKVLDSKC